jgi:hypothetical protein
MIDQLSIEYAASILSKYYKASITKKNDKAKNEIKEIMITYQQLVDIAKSYNEIEE